MWGRMFLGGAKGPESNMLKLVNLHDLAMVHDEKHEEVCYNPSLFYKKPGQLKCEEGILSVKHPSAASESAA